MPAIDCPTCARSIDLPLDYLAVWVECKDCAQQFLPLTGEVRASVLNERRSFDCQGCKAQFKTYATVSSNRPHCPKCGSSDTLPSEVAAYLQAKDTGQKSPLISVFESSQREANGPKAKKSFPRIRLREKTDERSPYWIVALVIGVLLIIGGTITLLVALLSSKGAGKRAISPAPAPISVPRDEGPSES
jgi:hypothetical protein